MTVSRLVRCILLVSLALPMVACKGPPRTRMHGQVNKLVVIDRTVGTGTVAKPGMDVLVQYTGWLYDDRASDKHGSQFDSTRGRSAPFTFVLGEGQVISGWDQGVTGMRVGGKRTLLIPASLAYGSRGADGVIPPAASLVFDIELVDARPR